MEPGTRQYAFKICSRTYLIAFQPCAIEFLRDRVAGMEHWRGECRSELRGTDRTTLQRVPRRRARTATDAVRPSIQDRRLHDAGAQEFYDSLRGHHCRLLRAHRERPTISPCGALWAER